MLWLLVNKVEEHTGKKIEDVTYDELVESIRFCQPLLFMDSTKKYISTGQDLGKEIECIILDRSGLDIKNFKLEETNWVINRYNLI